MIIWADYDGDLRQADRTGDGMKWEDTGAFFREIQ